MNEARPSRFVLRILRWYCPDHLVEEIEGDLIQRFNRDVVCLWYYAKAKTKIDIKCYSVFQTWNTDKEPIQL